MKAMRMRLVGVWSACFALAAASAIVTLLLLYAGLSDEDRSLALRMLGATGDLPFLIALLLAGVCGFCAAWIVRGYFVPLRAAAEGTTIARSGNPAHRLTAGGPAELLALIGTINALAHSHHAAIESTDARVAEAHADLVMEKNRFAVLLSALAQGVVVVNADERILLYNERARRLIARAAPAARGYLGIGRPVRDALPDPGLGLALDELRSRSACGEADPIVDSLISLPGEKRIRMRAAPVADASATVPDAPPDGFILLLEEVAGDHPTSSYSERSVSGALIACSGRPVYYDFDLFRVVSARGALDDLPLTELVYTVFDTETTGLKPAEGDEIIAIGAVRIVNRRIVPGETFDQLIDPRRPITSASTRIHGIDNTMLQGRPLIHQVLPQFHRFCADTILVGHNLAFDMRFLAEKEKATSIAFRQPLLDTLLLSAVLHPAQGDDRLEAIAHRFGIEVVARHDALGDAMLTAEIFLRMLPLLAEHGISTLRAARAAAEKTRYAHIRY